MARRYTIIVHPSGGPTRSLTVEDAMQQVLDAVRLLESVGVTAGRPRYRWLLHKASTNSPFTVEIEPYSDGESEVVLDDYAAGDVGDVISGINALASRQQIPQWMHAEPSQMVKRMLLRNTNGIGLTELRSSEKPTTRVLIDPPAATRAIAAISLLETAVEQDVPKHAAQGEITGKLISAGEHYNKPAVWIQTRSGERVTCIVPEHLAAEIGADTRLSEIWENQTVTARGTKHFGTGGKLLRMTVTTLERRKGRPRVNLDAVIDPDFTGGRSSRDYLDLIRGGDDD